LNSISKAELFVINRQTYSTFKTAVTTLADRLSRSELCIVRPGDAPSSKRFPDAISDYCVPYVVADYFFFPYENVFVDYSKCIKQLSSRRIENLSVETKRVKKEEVRSMREGLKIVEL
jgi:hypothetical protein